MRTYTVTEYDREDYDDLKNSMTAKDAIQVLEYIDRGWIPDYNFSGTDNDYDNYRLHVALYMAMDALEKIS